MPTPEPPSPTSASSGGKPVVDSHEWAEHFAQAVAFDWLPDENGQPRLAVASHPGFPFARRLLIDGVTPELRDQRVQAFANDYLDQLAQLPALGDIERKAFKLARQGDADGFGWLATSWGGGGVAGSGDEDIDPRLSFWVRRSTSHGALADRSLVLIAANRHVLAGNSARDDQRCEGFGVGLRLVIGVGPQDPGDSLTLLRITGCAAAQLQRVRLPDGLPGALRRQLIDDAVARIDFGADPVATRSQWFDAGSQRIELAGFVRRGGEGDTARVFEWSAQVALDNGNSNVAEVQLGAMVEQVADATRGAFRADPMSLPAPDRQSVARQPGRDDLDAYRENSTEPAGNRALQDPQGRWEVRQSVVANAANDPAKVQTVNPRRLTLRSDELSAYHADRRAREFFDRIAAPGLAAAAIFKCVSLPLVMRHRAWFHRQPDGMAVNAQVRPDGAGQSLSDGFDPTLRPRLEVRFGHADLSMRRLAPAGTGRHKRAQPLGLAADPRWAWHEFGHVLSAAATAALELPFVHSVGDALAAVVADPGSRLRNSQNGSQRGHAGGLTFPWVPVGRRHDRDAMLGWCWCGRLNRLRGVLTPGAARPLFKGYVEEQILSSTLFRLYRVLGGDCFADPARRQAASDYVVYLVMRAFAMMGPASSVSPLTPAGLADLLAQADAHTVNWSFAAPWPDAAAPRAVRRLGGTAHKVVRWAFERQGLDATSDPREVVDGPGRPPPVDLYVPGRGRRADGSYSPVALDWKADAAWHSPGLQLRAAGGAPQVVMTVRNRGRDATAVNGVSARAWVAPAGAANAAPPAALAWTRLVVDGVQPKVVQPGKAAEFVFRAVANGQALQGPWFVLGEVHALADTSNLHPDAALPELSGITPPTRPGDVSDLVANDNNLGLRRIQFA